MVKNIQSIIFDLGGVILDIDYHKTVEEFEKCGIMTFEQEFIQSHQSDFFQQFEKGEKTEEEFYEYVQKIYPLSISQIQSCWNAMLLRIPLRRLQILQQLQLHYNTFLLSNTNSIHEKAFNTMLREVCGFNTLAVFFDKIYYSHHIGMRKPDREIFELILNENHLNPERTLFIDDSIQHILTAQSLGIQTIHLINGMSIENDIFKSKNGL